MTSRANPLGCSGYEPSIPANVTQPGVWLIRSPANRMSSPLIRRTDLGGDVAPLFRNARRPNARRLGDAGPCRSVGIRRTVGFPDAYGAIQVGRIFHNTCFFLTRCLSATSRLKARSATCEIKAARSATKLLRRNTRHTDCFSCPQSGR